MNICFCNITAFEILRRLEYIPSVAYETDSNAALNRCGMKNLIQAKTYLEDCGLKADVPVHLLTSNANLSFEAEGTARHTVTASLPSAALITLDDRLFCTSPEETFLSLAASLDAQADRDMKFQAEARLALYGMELCGLFYFDPNELELRQRPKPLTTMKKIASYLSSCARRKGVGLAKKALEHVEDGSRSPMESAVALLLCRPRRIGSMGFPRGEINCRLETSEGEREVDRVWRKQGFAYEYQGREYHGVDLRRAEDRRRNALLSSGITVINIWYEDIAQPRAFDELTSLIARQLGIRLRIRSKEFAWRQNCLRSVVLPSLTRYG